MVFWGPNLRICGLTLASAARCLMQPYDYLTLHLFRLKPAEDWNSPREGLHFLLPQAGAGEYLSRPSAGPARAQPLGPGDVLVFGADSGGKVRGAARAELVSRA